MTDGQTPISPDDAPLKRLAQGVFLQLPTDLDEAERVLAYLGELLKWHRGMPYVWLDAETKPPPDGPFGGPPGDVLKFTKRG
jgi:hypothetical protein